ncbi:MAG: hypothetical protein CVU41_00730 [Chloroflexi bacterium HGW-Chloroflexi-3]|nr:MAG: hypothetical protein CVU41_00730 [Chloroflexi bacterium HGW-Chloroflexi-3]
MQIISTLFWLLTLINVWFSPLPQLDLVRIQSPVDGDYLQGSVPIIGTVTGTGLQTIEISFRYQDSQSQSWFVISQTTSPVVEDIITTWDTSTIADGVYQIRVLAVFENGREQEKIINQLNVRNYTPFDPIKTENPEVLSTDNLQNQIVIIETTPTLKSSPTPMPPNEMVITQTQFITTAIQGGILGVLFLFVIALFIIIRGRKMG